MATLTATNRADLQAAVLQKFKTVTSSGDDSKLASILENNGYDLKAAIEEFFSK